MVKENLKGRLMEKTSKPSRDLMVEKLKGLAQSLSGTLRRS